jgi:RNA recognition motif-containing protein
MTKKLYVGNLSVETTEADIRDLFAQAGVVGSVRIVTDPDTGRSKGFGFVEMEDGGDKAVAQFTGKELHGRVLKVNDARPRDSGGGFRR